MRQPWAWYRWTRFAAAFAAGGLLVALSGVPAFALSVPGAPPQPTVARGNAQIVVTFSPPASDGGLPILTYSASCTSGNGGTPGSNTGLASPITVSGLTNGKTYTCTVTASNALGAGGPSPASATVVPAAAPSAPTITSVTRGNASVSVAFTPGADNGSTITSFSASCTSLDGGAAGTDTGTASPITVTGLTNAKTYTCTVTATNAVGTSSASTPSLAVVPGAAPDAPTITSVTRGNASISVAFTPGAGNGFAILSYSASCTSSNGGTSGSNTGVASPITVSSLTNGKTYTCTVTATNAIGTSAPSSASAAVVPATVPDAPTITSVTRGNASVSVAFTAGASNGSAITSFSASCTSLDGGAAGTDSGTASPITVTGLTNGKTYTCTVTATNGVGTSSASTPSLPVVPAAVPDPPTITSATRGNASISVAFTPGADNGSPILSYAASCTSNNGGTAGSNTGTASPITVSGLTNGKSYTCTVTATNVVGTSGPSSASATVVPAAAPAAPTITSVTGGAASVSVAFTPGANNGSTITSFSATCTSSTGGASGTDTDTASPITVTGLTNGKTYTCTVTATNGVGTSSASLPSLPVVPGAAPDAPTITSVTRGNAQIVVAFTAPANDGGFPVLSYSASCISGNGGTSGSNTGVASPITVSGLTNGKTYTCTVTATNAIGTSAASPASASVIPAAAPDAPTVTSATRGNTSVSVAFTPGASNGSAITSFSASCTSLDGGAAGTDTGAASPISVTGLTNGKTYTCTVTATNAVGTSSASLPSLPVIPAAVPDPPAITSATRGNASITVAFTPGADNGSPISGFTAACASGNGGTSGSNTGTASPITVGGLTNGKTYTCTVTATNGVGTSPSSTASGTVIPATVPEAPAQPSVTRGNQQIVVSFTAPANNGSAITSYAAACTSSNGGTSGNSSGSATPITVSGLTNGKSYTCTVTATNDVGAGSPSPASASVVPATIPDAPAQPSVTRGNHQIVVSFTAPADNGTAITSYAASCTSPNGGTAATTSGSASPVTVTGLTNGKTYRCRVSATNAIGTGARSLSSDPIVPAGVPNPPAIGTASSGDGFASVTFGARADNGSPILSYSASCTSSNGGAFGSNSGAVSPITVNGLTNGKSYRCTVTATNAVGTSGPSAATPAFVPGRPGAPINVGAVSGAAPGATGPLRVSFAPGPDYGSPITSYRVACTSPNGGAAGSKTGTASPITVPALTTGKSYRCTVTATSARGAGAASSPARAIVGAPGTVTVLRTLPLAHGLALPHTRAADNGSPITGYRARCTSSDGGVAGYPLQLESPIVAPSLTDGKTYTCVVTAQNNRGEGPATQAGPIVVGRPNVTYLATCTGSAGSVGASPGLLYSTSKSQTFALASTMSSCSGPYVSAARISISFRSSTAINCQNAINVNSSGSGTLYWPTPRGMGKSAASLHFVITSSSGHVTNVHFYGDVTTKANVFMSSHVEGNITMNRGLQTVANGGDCSTTSRLTNFGITSITMRLS